MTTPCGILGCPHECLGAEITMAYENDFGVAVEQQVEVCHGHAFAILRATREARGEPALHQPRSGETPGFG